MQTTVSEARGCMSKYYLKIGFDEIRNNLLLSTELKEMSCTGNCLQGASRLAPRGESNLEKWRDLKYANMNSTQLLSFNFKHFTLSFSFINFTFI
jgi:hypothetical protein